MSALTVGIVGLGRMGSNMGRRLLDDGYEVVGFDVREEAREAFEEAGGDTASAPAGVAESVEVLISSLPTTATVEEVYLGREGIADAAPDPDFTAIEMSTVDPSVTERIADEAPSLSLIDAPVSGGPDAGRRGRLMIIAGGDEETYGRESVRQVLDALGEQVFYAGGLGSGHTVKLLNNLLSMGNLLLAMEIVTMGVDAGIEPDTLDRILSNTGGSSNQFRKRFPRAARRDFDPGFTVDYAKKDIGLALDVAERNGVPMMLSSLVHQHYVEASTRGYGDEDVSSVVKLFESAAGAVVEDREIESTFTGYSSE